MSSPPTIIVESHRSAATLYATGELTTAGVMDAIARVERLPEHVRALRVDLRGVQRTDSHALRALDIALRAWRAARRGMSRVKLAQGLETSLVAIKFAHQRWTRASRHPGRTSGTPGGRRFRDHRQAVVTRSLRERASSETR
jgi:ABC-type transporter Mla MlaB component